MIIPTSALSLYKTSGLFPKLGFVFLLLKPYNVKLYKLHFFIHESVKFFESHASLDAIEDLVLPQRSTC